MCGSERWVGREGVVGIGGLGGRREGKEEGCDGRLRELVDGGEGVRVGEVKRYVGE